MDVAMVDGDVCQRLELHYLEVMLHLNCRRGNPFRHSSEIYE